MFLDHMKIFYLCTFCIMMITITSATRFVCYFPNWARYRTAGTGVGAYYVDNIDPNLCTHLIYAFAVLNSTTFHIQVYDQWADIDSGGYSKFVALKSKNPQLKTMIAIGGWDDSHLDDKYSNLVSDSKNIASFVESVMIFLSQYRFDGLDLDWEYPESPEDKIGFANLITALRAAFKPMGYFLSAAVACSAEKTDAGYDVPTMNATLDFINLMAYDMHGPWETVTDNHAPLYQRPWETNENNNIDFIVQYWQTLGLSADKINMGIPTYGQSWTLASSETGIGAPALGGGAPGPLTNISGTLGYYEICYYIRTEGWTVVQDPDNLTGPYAYSPQVENKTWVGYDDVNMATVKSRYVKEKGLGGAMIWDMSTDDFKNRCGDGFNPISNAIANAVKDPSTTSTTTSTSTSTTTTSTTTSTTTTTSAPPTTSATPTTPISSAHSTASSSSELSTMSSHTKTKSTTTRITTEKRTTLPWTTIPFYNTASVKNPFNFWLFASILLVHIS